MRGAGFGGDGGFVIDGARRGLGRVVARAGALVALAALMALPLLGAAPATPSPGQSLPGQPAPPLPTIASGPAPDLDLLFTAQVAGWIEPCG